LKITRIDCHVLLDPNFNIGATSSAQDDIVVEIHTDEGLTGIGETDVNPWIAKACILAPGTHTMALGLSEMLIGQDPMDIEGIWERLYTGSAMTGRRGVVINAIGALDMALHDLRGKALGKPCYELFGGAVKDSIMPYASLQPEVSSFQAYKESLVAWALDAKARGYKAAKAECTLEGPYAHMGLREPYYKMTEVIAAVREAVGPDFILMVDAQYAFPDADTCLQTIRDWEDLNIYFLEAPIPMDDLAGYRRLSEEQSIPIAAGEWLTTRFEFLDLMNYGNVAVVQPDMGRVGGLTEALRVAALAKKRGLKVVPHLWKTGISIAAATHFSAVNDHCPFIEFLPAELCESSLRKGLLLEEPKMIDGVIPLPKLPGLGIEINREVLAEYEEAAMRVARERGL
jgi:L-alanine-DL-glutamate epimerase-like enolase superfamily enzyme